MPEDEKCLDRSCFLFVLQGVISLLVMIGCFVMLILDIESRYAQSILTLFVGVWLPSPSVTPITQSELAQPLRSRVENTAPIALPPSIQLVRTMTPTRSSFATEFKSHESETKET